MFLHYHGYFPNFFTLRLFVGLETNLRYGHFFMYRITFVSLISLNAALNPVPFETSKGYKRYNNDTIIDNILYPYNIYMSILQSFLSSNYVFVILHSKSSILVLHYLYLLAPLSPPPLPPSGVFYILDLTFISHVLFSCVFIIL